jgi:hypothetical protein
MKIFLIKDFESIKSKIMKEHKKQILDIVNKLKRTDLLMYDEKKIMKIYSENIAKVGKCKLCTSF